MSSNRPMGYLTPGQRMSVSRARVQQLMPYFSGGVQSMVPKEQPGLESVAITDESVLLWDPDYLAKLTPDEGAGVLIHHYMHLFLRHADRTKKMQALGILQDDDLETWNQACCAEINDNLVEARLQLPHGMHGETVVTPRSLGLPDNRTAEEYYSLLLKKKQQKPKSKQPPPPKQGGGNTPPNGPGQAPGNQPAAGCGFCGSGAGRPVPDEPQGDPDGRSPMDQEVQRKGDCAAIQAHAAKGRGDVPLGLRRLADAMVTPAQIPWQTKLARATRNAVAYRPGAVDYTRSKPSRRQGTYFGQDMQPILPSFRRPIVNVAVVADTSGSIGEDLIQTILGEIDGVLKVLAGAQITFVACDAQVHTFEKIRDVKAARRGMKGGGGTDFRPAFTMLQKAKTKPEVVIFATDGFGTWPNTPPKGMKVLWLILPGGQNSCPWGEVIEMRYGRT